MGNCPSQQTGLDPSLHAQRSAINEDTEEMIATKPRQDSVLDPRLQSKDTEMTKMEVDVSLGIELCDEQGKSAMPDVSSTLSDSVHGGQAGVVQAGIRDGEVDREERKDGRSTQSLAANVDATSDDIKTEQKDNVLEEEGNITAPSSKELDEQHQPSAPTNNDAAAMPPPPAPASMLYDLRASETAKKPDEQTHDRFVCARLAAVTVTLFRMGKAKESKALGQFAVDLMGEELWDELLLEYMSAEPDEEAAKWILIILDEAAAGLKAVDPPSSGFLSILISLVGQGLAVSSEGGLGGGGS